MKMTEKSMKAQEARIPKMAAAAFRNAQNEALRMSGKVLRAVNGKLVETRADGTETVLRSIQSPVKVTMGAKFKLKRRAISD
jgi:hypothetical protein